MTFLYWTAMTLLLLGLFAFAAAMWRFSREKDVDDEIWLSEDDSRRRHPSSWDKYKITLVGLCFVAAAYVDGSVG